MKQKDRIEMMADRLMDATEYVERNQKINQKLSQLAFNFNDKACLRETNRVNKMLEDAAQQGSLTKKQALKIYRAWAEGKKAFNKNLAAVDGFYDIKYKLKDMDAIMEQMLIDKLCWYVAQPELAARADDDREM